MPAEERNPRMIGRSYGDRMQCWPSGINCQNFVLDKGTISDLSIPLIIFRGEPYVQLQTSACGVRLV